MSRLSEYLRLLPLGFEHREEIFDSIVNQVKSKLKLLPEDEQEEIIRRRVICESCPYNSKNAKKNDNYKTDRVDDHCILCSCNISIKTSSLMSECGASIWNQNYPKESEIPLKWNIYIKST